MTDNRWRQPTGSVCAQIATAAPEQLISIAEAGTAALNEGVIIHNSTGEIVWCNSAACRLLQLRADQLVGRTWSDLDRQPVRTDGTVVSIDKSPWMEAFRTGVSVTNSVLGIRRADGSTVWLSVDSKLAMGDREQVVATLLLDVTAEFDRRSEIDEAMRQIEESMFQTTLPSSARIEFASKTRASAAQDGTGRDFCGAYRLSEHRYSFFLGRIRAVQTEAACANSFVRHTLHSAGSLLHDPHEVLFHLRDAIEREWPETDIEAIFGYVDVDSTTESAEIRVACGGLPMPMAITSSGISQLGRDDSVIDDVSDRKHFTDSVQMLAGNRVVLSTDRGFARRALASQIRNRDHPLRPHAPIGEVLTTSHNIAAEPELDHESDRDVSVLLIAFD